MNVKNNNRNYPAKAREAEKGISASTEFPYLWFCLLLIAVIATVYGQVVGHQFISYDDRTYVTENAVVLEGLTWHGICWAFTTTIDANWLPLTWLSHMLDVQLFGTNPAGHHLVNVAIHCANALILFAFLSRMTGSPWRSAVVAALFALHPLRVESVAWVAERKDVLSAFFAFLAIYAYCRYAECPGVARYLVVILLFAFGLMSKPMIVTLPFLLLLLDFWPLRRLSTDYPANALSVPSVSLCSAIIEKLPMLLLSAVSSVITFIAQKNGGAVSALDHSSLLENLENALVSYVVYLYKLVWPTKLAVIYPFQAEFHWWQPLLAASALVVVTGLILWQLRIRPYLATGWFWYLGTMVPVIGLVRVGVQAYADRYTYLPLLGATIILVWGIAEMAKSWLHQRAILIAATVAAIAVCAVTTFFQIRHWQDTVSLFRHAVAVTENNYIAHNNLAAELIIRGEHVEAEQHLLEVIRIKPDHAGVYTNLGVVHMMQKRRDLAIKAYRSAIQYDPQDKVAYMNLGTSLINCGDLEGAYVIYQRFSSIDPVQAKTLLGMITYAKKAALPRNYPSTCATGTAVHD